MTDTPEKPAQNPTAAGPDNGAERIAKVMARAGVASRREAERMILEGRVTVNGRKIDSPALDVTAQDRIRVDGQPLEAPQETRLWLYYKPLGLVTSNADEKGRQTVFDALPRDLPRVMTVGRLDLNSEGLLLLTNDGELKRRLELPSTGWLRRYRVRVNGTPNDLTFAPLRRGVTIDGEEFQPMEISLDSQQGANAWLTVGIREGRNREIRRAMAHVGLIVNRLIRIGYGPFKLTGLEENEVREVKRKVLRDQLGGLLTGEVEEKPRQFRERGARSEDRAAGRPSRPARPMGEAKPFARRGDAVGKGAGARDHAGAKPYGRRDGGGGAADGARAPRPVTADGQRRPYARRDDDAAPRLSGKPGPAGRRTGEKPAAGARSWSKSDARPRAGAEPRAGAGAAGQSGGYRSDRSAADGGRPASAGGFKPRAAQAVGKGPRAESGRGDGGRINAGRADAGRGGKPASVGADRPGKGAGFKPGKPRSIGAGKPADAASGSRRFADKPGAARGPRPKGPKPQGKGPRRG
ncbi:MULTISPECIES: pseudouridine synthase [unclassified Paracoccus (in: a-proteobacteria)]|uniref:pseudouridine synthase n=1 Tax=unclassified Paracoccus (in: a-proteobacteria) TaxID=2688777 RepID=UPI0021E18822|nr:MULTISPECIES: pseudouridine synthase [unclassified Paracoccus (in: a-proteobacteria)]UXU75009.1 pseudouridine synthase [Paracoccus sp. SMMA_5]UXU80912.1 pseudouridine synthase [Paracoccus sp. SMMA_5_TC]